MSRRTKRIVLGLFLVLVSIPVVHVSYTWHPVNPLRVRVLRVESVPASPGQDAARTLHLEVRNTHPSATLRLDFASLSHKAGYAVLRTAAGEIPTPAASLVRGDGLPMAHLTEVILPPKGLWRAQIVLPLSEAETGPLQDSTIAYGYSSSTRFRILMFCRSLASHLPMSWRNRQWPDPFGEHLPTIEFPQAFTSLEPAP